MPERTTTDTIRLSSEEVAGILREHFSLPQDASVTFASKVSRSGPYLESATIRHERPTDPF